LDRRLLGYFTALFLPLVALLVAAGAFAYRLQVRQQVAAVELHETIDAERGAQTLTAQVQDFTRDLLFIRSLQIMQQPRIGTDAASRQSMESIFALATETKRDVDQIRWIDETGRERVRIDTVAGRPVIRGPAELQDKSGRYYVTAINELAPGEVYVSPLDLNVEHDAIELPHKPMLRIGTPLLDAAGTRRGMVVLNFRAEAMLADFVSNTQGLHGESMLLNGAGYSLRSANPRDDWGFMFDHEDNFATRYPAAWKRIHAMGSGRFKDESGLWTFATARPQFIAAATAASVDARPRGGQGAATAGEAWLVVTHVSAAELAQMIQPLRATLLGGTALLLVLGGVLNAFLARAWCRREARALANVQREARESSASLRLILQSNPNAMLIVDRHGFITDANPSAEATFGRGAVEMRALRVEELVPSAVSSSHARLRDSYFAASHARPMGAGVDLTARRKDGTEFPVEISLAPLTLRGEAFVVATVVDITARKQAEKKVRKMNASLERRVEERTLELGRAEADLRLLLESSASGLYGVDCTGRVTFMNPAACAILGVDAAQIVGTHSNEFLADEGRQGESGNYVERTLRDGLRFTVDDANFRHAAGGTVPVMFSTHPMVRDGEIVGAVVSFTDMTERRRLDAAREDALHEAERLAKARSEFLSNMSHEIRTPLNGVLGVAQVGHRDLHANPVAREAFTKILESGRTLLGIVDNVLDFSRIEAGKVRVDATLVRLPDLLDEVVVSISPLAAAKNLGLRVVREPGCPELCVTDPMRVKQILLNLMGNAVKFTERGEVVLNVGRDGDKLRFVVRDTGIGISPEQAERIFSAFEQADSSTTRRFGGTGLGLAICRRITELMQGTITMQSHPGAGSEFTVTLPLIEPPAGSVAPSAHDVDSSGTRRIERLGGLRILLAEDNEVNQMVVQAMLSKEGSTLVTVSDGAQAVDAVRQSGAGAFHVVLMDIQMPVMGGYEATRLIHEIDPDLPVIGQTAHVLQEAIEQCRAAGMVAHLAKPIDRHELILTIMRHARIAARQD